jgi:CRP/FNR family transcriptional regulator
VLKNENDVAATAPKTPEPLPADHPCVDCEVRNLAVCSVLCARDLAQFRNSGTNHRLRGGDPLFHEGDESGQVYTLTRGTLKLYKLLPDGRRQVTGFMFPGDFLGISVDDTHAFTAEALEDAQLCKFRQSRFDEFVEAHPEMERELYRLAAHELAAAQQQMVLLGRKTANERLASFLLVLVERVERETGEDCKFARLPMSRLDIADYLGLTKETVSRVIAELRRRRLIRLQALDVIEILDRRGLAELADGMSAE